VSGSTATDPVATLEVRKPRALDASRWLNITAALGFVIPVCAYLWFIQHYGVNVIWRDQWSDVNLARQLHMGRLSLGTLWAPHNQNRLLFPNLLVVVLAQTTRLNLFVEMYLSALILVASIALCIWTHKRRSPSTHWIFYCPVAILLLSFVQYENTLSGFQVCWYFVLAALAVTLFFLDSPRFGWTPLICAVVAAVVGSYSAIQGLYIWPVGLLLLYQRRRSLRDLVTWVAAGVATTAVFFYHLGGSSFGESPGSITSALGHPILTAKFFFLAIGDVVGAWIPWPLPWRGPTASTTVSWAALLLGVVIFAIAAWVLVTCLGRDEEGPSPVGVALIGFGLLFALSIATGRSTLIGLWYAGTSRYTTFDLLVLVGVYLALLGRVPPLRARRRSLSLTDDQEGERVPGLVTLARKVKREDGSLGVIVRGSLAIVFCVQVILGLLSGLAGGRSTHQVGLATEDVIVNVKQAPDSVIERTYFGPDVTFARQMALVAVKLRLSFLASTAGSQTHQREGLDVGVWEGGTTSPVTPWRGLQDGQIVTIDAQHFAGGYRGPLIVSECNANALFDPKACDLAETITVSPGSGGSIQARYRVTTGTVGDGTCDAGQACYIGVSSPHDPSLLSFAEITF
jgi:hypothetical protein